MSSPLNTTRAKCFIETPILSLVGEQNTMLAINMMANILLMLTATLGNFSILLSFVLVSSLRSTSNYLLVGLALTDLGVGVVVHPLYIFVLFSVYTNSVPHCFVLTAYSIATSFLSGISLLYITLIGMDRYLAIRLHLRYRQLVTEKRINVMQISVWVINAALSLVWVEGFHVYSTFAAVVVSISLLVTFYVYIKVYLVVRRHRVQIHDQMDSIDSQMLHFENCRLKRLRRSAINTLYVFFAFLICYLPFSVTTTVNNISSSPNRISVLAFEFSATLMLSNSSLNPLMYCIRLPEFKRAIKKTYRRVLCLKKFSGE